MVDWDLTEPNLLGGPTNKQVIIDSLKVPISFLASFINPKMTSHKNFFRQSSFKSMGGRFFSLSGIQFNLLSIIIQMIEYLKEKNSTSCIMTFDILGLCFRQTEKFLVIGQWCGVCISVIVIVMLQRKMQVIDQMTSLLVRQSSQLIK